MESVRCTGTTVVRTFGGVGAHAAAKGQRGRVADGSRRAIRRISGGGPPPLSNACDSATRKRAVPVVVVSGLSTARSHAVVGDPYDPAACFATFAGSRSRSRNWCCSADPSRAACPIVMIHGGGLTGLRWESTPDGCPGRADFFAQRGFPTHVRQVRPPPGRGCPDVSSSEARESILTTSGLRRPE
ncbi:hypothetical protein GCM10027445_00190 [Amycolatopsis endophytica]